jgi:S1-C subfamily serine protease
MSVLQDFSNALANTVETAGQSVVRIEARKRLPATGIVWSDDGIIVTSNHVVQRDDNIFIGLPNGDRVAATLVGRDPHTDLAVLRADTSGLTAPNWEDTDDLKAGHLILGLGRPSDHIKATLGIVIVGDARGRGPRRSLDRYIQTDITMYPGFSGGPLVDASGSFRGLNTSGLARGVGVTIPTESIRHVVTALLEHGKIKQGYLGVAAQVVRLPDELSKDLDQERGLLIVNVEPGSPAQESGLLLGDTLIAFDDQPLNQMEDLLGLLTSDRVGASVPIKLVRGGQLQELNVTVGERS